MLKKCFRLKNNAAFGATYKNRKIVANEYFILYAGKEKECKEQITRFGFVVSKKIHKRAVKRNRIKRLLRESVRIAQKKGEIDCSNKLLSYVFVAKTKALELDFDISYQNVVKLVYKVSN